MPGSADGPAADGAPADMATVSGVTRTFGRLTAVADVSFRVPQGQIVGLVGSDGAGKTTLLRMIATMIPPSAGRITVGGRDAVAERGRVKELIGYMPQRFALYPDLTVDENLGFCMDVYGVTGPERRRRRERFLGFSNLLPFVDRRAADLSGGMKQKLGLACVLVHRPRFLVLDEPTNGVDPVSRREFWRILADMRAEGMSVLVATAYLDEGELCDRLLIMHAGRILADAAPAEVRAGHADLEQAMIDRIRAADEGLSHDAFGA